MMRRILAVAAVLALGSAAAHAESAREVRIEPTAPSVADLERVDSIVMLRGPHSWRVIDRNTLIVWATPFDPYLIELAFPANELEFTHVIGLSQTGSRVYAGFDNVYVRGFRYPIESIYKLTREEARSWGKNQS